MAEIVYRDRETIVSNTLYTDGQIKTVTVSELVRCKYCKHYHSALCYCTLKGTRNWQPDDYCSSGRREGM